MKKINRKELSNVGFIETTISNKIYIIRGRKVMLDYDLAELYEVPTKVLNQSVKRNVERFPEDFMFQLSKDEESSLKSQFVTSNLISKRGGRRKPILAFSEQGVSMLSTVLNSDRAIQVNIQIMRIFTKIREMILSHKDLQEKIEELEKTYNGQFEIVFKALRQLMGDKKKSKKIGFKTE